MVPCPAASSGSGSWTSYLSNNCQHSNASYDEVYSDIKHPRRRSDIKKTYFRLFPSPITLTIIHWIHSPSAFFCFGSRYATSALRCKASMDVGAADMLRATFVLRLEGLSEAIASSSLRLPRFFSTAINRSEKKSAYILASHCEGKKKDNRNDGKETTGRIQASFTVQGFFNLRAR